MPLEFRPWIVRVDLKSEPRTLFLFGDNEERSGFGGQARECRGELNAVGVATKRAPGSRPEDFWTDDDFARITRIIDTDLSRAFVHVADGGLVVCPRDGIGTGLSQLPKRAPMAFAHLRRRIIDLKRLG